MPWDFLRKAAERSAAVAIVLDRTPADAVETVSTHLARMLASRGLKDSPLFTVEEGPVSETGLLAAAAVIEIRHWLQALADDPDGPRPRSCSRPSTARSAPWRGARTPSRTPPPSRSTPVRRLREDADEAYDRAVTAVGEASADGTLLRGEVLARWQEFVGTGELLRSLETKVGWLRDRVVNAVKGKPQQAERVTVAVESGLETLILEHAEAAAERAEASWQSARRRPGAARRRRRGPRPRLPRLPPPGRARGARLAGRRARDGAHRGRRQALAPPGSWRSASTGCRWR